MPRDIEKSHDYFHKVIGGRLRKELKKFIKTGHLVRQRGKNGKINIPVKGIDQPRFVHGESDHGVGRGPGKKGDVIGRDKQAGGKKGNKAGDEPAEGVIVQVDLEYVLQFAQDELELPDLKPKQIQTFEDVDIKYTSIAKVGPESLRHNRRTMLQAMKRLAASGEIDKLHHLPGHADPMRLITPINSDRRYRQYREIHPPNSQAVILMGRDGSYSMDDIKCEIVSDICWWTECWIRRYYKKTEVCYFWHDTAAKEVDHETFYKLRLGGGTLCSSCLELMAHQFENRFPPPKWNIYVLYFTDGENDSRNNPVFVDLLRDKFGPEVCNLFALTQVMSMDYDGSVKQYVDNHVGKMTNLRTVSVGPETSGYDGSKSKYSEEDRDKQVLDAIRAIFSPTKTGK